MATDREYEEVEAGFYAREEDNDQEHTRFGRFCQDERHETPCPLPCSACAEECDTEG